MGHRSLQEKKNRRSVKDRQWLKGEEKTCRTYIREPKRKEVRGGESWVRDEKRQCE